MSSCTSHSFGQDQNSKSLLMTVAIQNMKHDLFQASSLTVFHPWQDSAFTKGFVLLCVKSRECEFIRNVCACHQETSILVGRGSVCESSSSFFLRASSVMWIRFSRGFSALLWYQYSVPQEIKTPGLFYFPLK